MSDLLEGLNNRQREAVSHTDGPLLIFAGAGSGKTRVLTTKIAYLLAEKKTVPSRILAVTFTNKAASEMKERVGKLLGDKKYVNIGTFHSVCAKILRMERSAPDFSSDFTIYDTQDKKAAIKEALKTLRIDSKLVSVNSAAHYISSIKQKMLTPDEALEKAGNYHIDKQLAEIYKEVDKIMRQNNAYDFDDLLVKPLQMFQKYPAVLEKYAHRWDYILVDEYQDTNLVQFRFLEYLTRDNKNICVVGDDDQSIYGWRGADISNILEFEKVFPNAVTVKLEQNYRSTKTILRAAASMIVNNSYRAEKTMWSEAEEGEKIDYKEVERDYQEANFIASQIARSGKPAGNFAILYRTNAQSRLLEEALRNRSIRYNLVGGVKFYERKEIKDLLGYMNILVNPRDNVNLKRIINVPARGIGNTSLQRLEVFSTETHRSLFEALQYPEQAGLGKAGIEKVNDFLQMMLRCRELMESYSPSEFVIELLKQSGLLAQYEDKKDPEIKERYNNLEEFVNGVKLFEMYNENASIMDFLQDVSLQSDIDQWEDSSDAVTLMTIHSAKGLEFDQVFIAGLEEGLFPLEKAMLEKKEMEEERRLFYVAITRARSKVVLTSSKQRMRFGVPQRVSVSPFIYELPSSLVSMDKINKKMSAPSYSHKGGSETRRPIYREHDTVSRKPERKPIRPARPGAVNVGSRIEHRMFGKGKVTAVIRSSQTLLKIKFDNGVNKTIAEKFVELI